MTFPLSRLGLINWLNQSPSTRIRPTAGAQIIRTAISGLSLNTVPAGASRSPAVFKIAAARKKGIRAKPHRAKSVASGHHL